MNQQEGIGEGRVSGLRAGYSMIEIKQMETSRRAQFTTVKMFDELMRNWCRRMHLDSWKSPLDLLADGTLASESMRTRDWLMEALR
jgi:hypothetical protein